jgi:CRP-like cAMP-binding protein
MLFYDLFRGEPRTRALPAGVSLFRRGDATNGFMYVLIKGQAEIRVGDEVVDLARVGAILGEMALVDKGPRSATVVATTDAEFAEIDRERFEFLIAETPGFAIEVMRLMASRLRKTDELLSRRVAALV